jgi:hypothetical protein
MDAHSSPPARPRARDRIAVWGFCLLWLFPVVYVGTTRRAPPMFPPLLAELTNVTCLFTRAQPSWSTFYVQARTSASGPWLELDTRADFGLEPFGHRTRLDRYLVAWSGARGEAARDELAQWFMKEHATRRPSELPLVELRFVTVSVPARHDRPPTGAWVRPRLDDTPPNHRRVLSTHVRRTRP